MQPLFEIGQLYVDHDALTIIRKNGASIDKLLEQHEAGDWGEGVASADVIENANALSRRNGSVMSVHTIGGETITITTTLMWWRQPNQTDIEILE